MSNKKLIKSVLFLSLVILTVWFFVNKSEEVVVINDNNSSCGLDREDEHCDGDLDDEEVQVNNFFDCVNAGNPVMESYPRKCSAGDAIYTENIGNELEKQDLIRLDTPRPNEKISSPVKVIGQARGNWFFEGDFPVVLTNWDGLIIAEGYASAKGDWMTDEFVEFESELVFDASREVYDRGTLILQKDNVSDDTSLDDALEVSVFFMK